MPELRRHFIAGARGARSTASFQATNPKTGATLERAFAEGTAGDVDDAAQAAARDFTAYQRTSPKQRAAFLNTIAAELEARGEALVKCAAEETGLPPQPRLQGELARTVNQLKLFAKVVTEGSFVEARIDRPQPDRKPLPKPDVRSMKVALGPVAVFGASNFPLAFSVAGGDTASALAAGCPVVVKAHPAHPGTSELAGEAIARAVASCEMPPGTFSLLQGSGVELGQALVKHPAIKAVGFTGSFGGGKALFDLAAARPEPIPVYAEMGSANPVFVLPHAAKERAEAIAAGLAASATLGVGQFCTSPGLVFGPRSEAFQQQVKDQLLAKGPGTMLHAGIKSSYEGRVAELAATPGVACERSSAAATAGCDALPGLLRTDAATFAATPTLEEEVFGPAFVLIACESTEQMVGIARKLRGHLTATLHATDQDLAACQALVAELQHRVGRIVLNGYPTGVEVCAAMVHGGPFPSTSDARMTSVGTAAIDRFLRPVCFQDFVESLLPEPLRNKNTRSIPRRVDGELGRGDV